MGIVTSGTTTHYVYDGDGRVIGEYGVSATDVKAEYIWLSPEVANDNVWGGTDGVGGHAPLAVSSAPAGGTALLSWVHANHIGAPLLTTNVSGTAISPSGYTQIAFPGQLRTLPDLYYNRYRDYDPTTGRYVQADPIGLDGDANPYAYAMNNPLRYTDPTGEFVPLIVVGGIAAGALIDLGIQYFVEGKTLNCIDWGSVAISGGLGGIGGGLGPSALKTLTRSEFLFGRHGVGVLNRNNLFRIGRGWKGYPRGSLKGQGREVFRAAFGHRSWPKIPLSPRFPWHW